MKKTTYILLLIIISIFITSCNQKTSSTDLPDNVSDISEVIYKDEDLLDTYDSSDDVITLTNESITSSNQLVSISDDIITITKEGVYSFSGSSETATIYINTSDTDLVVLLFNNLDLSSDNGPIVYVENADKVIINLTGNSSLTDSSNETYEDDAVIYSKDDLTINGLGSLTIQTSYQKGIKVNDDLIIINSTINISSFGHAIKTNQSLTLKDVTLTIDSAGDGIKSYDDENETESLIFIDGGTYTIESYGDAISSYDLTVYGGSFTLTSGISNTNISTTSAKGIKTTHTMYLLNGTFNITSKDDGLHSNDSLIIYNGTYIISSSDDGIHADDTIELQNGIIEITKSYEGLEASNIYISGGEISITSSDDGINGSGGSDSSSNFNFDHSDGSYVSISGGIIYIYANGDGLDSNGDIYMSGGTVLIAGPSDNSNGAIDYNGSFELDGGILVAAGASGMAENVSTSSQVSVKIGLSSSTSDIFQLQDEDGNDIITFNPGKTYNSIVISTTDLNVGDNYNLYIGDAIDSYETTYYGFYTGSSLTNQSLSLSFTIDSKISSVGTSSSMGGGGGFNPGGRP